MEHSIYNIVVDTADNEHTIYNTLKRCLVVLDDEAFSTYERCEGSHLQDLMDAGLIIESASYEQDVQERAFDHDRFTNDWFALCLCPTYECNYQCPYCYEHGCNPGGIMSREVIEATYRFCEKVYERDRFKSFSLGWYGGEPTLCMNIIEEMTGWFRGFCDEHGIDMSLGMLSNCGMIDDDLAKRMANIGFEHLMPTIDGFEELHNRRRVNRSGVNSFQKTLEGARSCQRHGIEVRAAMNVDKINMRQFRELRQRLHDEEGIDIYPSLLKDYRQDFDRNDTGFDSSSFDLYTREEYAWDIHGLFEETPYTKEVMKGLLRPVRNFCRGQLENYYVIDPFGDAYKCEGWLGQREHAAFSILDLPDIDGIITTGYNPLRDPQCRDCRVMPLCKGQCEWDRALLEHACHVAVFTIEAYVRDYRSCYGDVSGGGSVVVLEEPVDFVAELDSHFLCDGPNESRWAGNPWYGQGEGGEPAYSKGKFWHDKMAVGEASA